MNKWIIFGIGVVIIIVGIVLGASNVPSGSVLPVPVTILGIVITAIGAPTKLRSMAKF